MRCLMDGSWEDSSLDYHRPQDMYRVQVGLFANLEPVQGTYFILPRSTKLLWNYFREVGLRETWRKVMSRLQERNRNEKFLSIGIGEIVSSPRTGDFEAGERVLFLAPGLPACVERAVLPSALLVPAPAELTRLLEEDSLLYLSKADIQLPAREWWQSVSAWNPYSGSALSDGIGDEFSAELTRMVSRADWSGAKRLAQPKPTQTQEIYTTLGTFVAPGQKQKRAVLFGYGHYAKTNILPNVRRSVKIEAIHEIDPTQIPKNWGQIQRWDSSPSVRATENYDVYFIAGYHHSHAPIATTALRRGAYAVAEKPIAVERDQLADLLEAMDRSEHGFFACFHKRYSPFNEPAWQDLGCSDGEAINYHCIVYEVPLPAFHWYRWPNSKSRLVSNGCHWLDHFLYLNRFCPVESFSVEQSPDESINCSVTLENGAYFTMALTDRGSQRIGLQDYVELRAKGVTVKIVNNAHYMAEDSMRVLRRSRINKTLPYHLMYSKIASQIAREAPGDTSDSVRISTELVLDLEEHLEAFEQESTQSLRPTPGLELALEAGS